MTKYQLGKQLALEVIHSYPRTVNGSHFLTMKNGKRLFFDIFIRKYGLNGVACKYTDADVYRRVKIIEAFEFYLKTFDTEREDERTISINTKFFRFVIRIHTMRDASIKYELLSFYEK